jgi:2-polyprenyl-3-methyl-5-hydroxy-6-metoxy-1,4-benzoquinol methylase
MVLPTRTLQYLDELKIASEVLGEKSLLEGHGKKALDVGCGKGYGLLALRLLGYEAYGFDINPDNIAYAKSLGFKEVLVYNLEDGIPFHENFDLITCFGVLEHVRVLDKALEVLLKAPYHYLIITVPNLHTEFLRLFYLILRGERIPASLTRGKGFLMKDEDHVNMFPPVAWRNRIIRTLRKLNVQAEVKNLNYILLTFKNRNLIFKLPYAGSSSMITVTKSPYKCVLQ